MKAMKRIFSAFAILTLSGWCAILNAEDARDPGEALCGPEIVLIGDAWEHVKLDRNALRSLVSKGDLVLVPQRLSSMASHLTFMRNRSIMVFGGALKTLHNKVGEVINHSPRWNALALGNHRADLAKALDDLDACLDAIAAQYPDEALVTSSASSFLLPPVVPSLQIKLDAPLSLAPEVSSRVRFRLVSPKGAAVTTQDLHTTHGEKLHALVLDPLFRDYQHLHPQPSGNDGEYTFEFTPRVSGPYRLWLDVMPVATGRTEFPIVDLMKIPRPIAKAPAPVAAIHTATGDGWACELGVPGDNLVFEHTTQLSITVRDHAGTPVTRLQPLMGAFAHVVAFADDFQTIFHIHPIGPMPGAEDLGGPKIEFQIRPTQPGWLRIYAQFSIADKVHVAAFAVKVVVR